MVCDVHLSETGNTDRLWVEVIKDFGQRPPHIRQEERIDIFVRRRIAFVLQRAHRARPFQRQHDAVVKIKTTALKVRGLENSQRSHVLS